MRLPVEEQEIQAFRVYVSGQPQTFDSLDVAVDYLKSMADLDKIAEVTLETTRLTREEYRLEVEDQELESLSQ